MRLLASSVGVARVQRPYHRDALEEISRLFFSRAEQRRSGQWEEQDGQKAGRAATNPISRSVENNGLPEDTRVLASVTRHRPEPWRHRTCGFVESGSGRPKSDEARDQGPGPRYALNRQTEAAEGSRSQLAAICHAEGRGFESHQPLPKTRRASEDSCPPAHWLMQQRCPMQITARENELASLRLGDQRRPHTTSAQRFGG